MAPLAVELTAEGSLRLPAALAAAYFPGDAMVARVVERELWLVPVRGEGGGGLILKRRNRAGDRAVVIWEMLPADVVCGDLPAFWDAPRGTLRIALGRSRSSGDFRDPATIEGVG